MLRLKDRRIAALDSTNQVVILKLNNNTFSVDGYNNQVSSVCQIDNENIVSVLGYENITIWSIKDGNFGKNLYSIKNPHPQINHNLGSIIIINLSNNFIASGGNDGLIKIWNCIEPYSNTPIKMLKGHSTQIVSMIFIKEKNSLISAENEMIIKWNLNTYQSVSFIEIKISNYTNSLYQVDDNRIIIGDICNIYLLNINTMVVEHKINDKNLGPVSSFFKLRDNITILVGAFGGRILIFNLNTKNIIIYTPCNMNKKRTQHSKKELIQ